MRRATLLAAIVLAFVLIAAVPVVASEARANLEASLTGEKEVPGPGDPNGRGEADVKVYKAKVCYELEVERIKPATFAHIHRGAPNAAGDIVVKLKAPTDGSSEGCKAISKQLSKKLREHPSHYYVNVHNDPYPDGAIRGQLHRDD
jgi:CHRD domain